MYARCNAREPKTGGWNIFSQGDGSPGNLRVVMEGKTTSSHGKFYQNPSVLFVARYFAGFSLRFVKAQVGPDLVHALEYTPFIPRLQRSMGCCTSKQIDTAGDDGPTEQKPASNAASPETKNSTPRSDHSLQMALPWPNISIFGNDRQATLPTGNDMTQFESVGQAPGWAESMPVHPPLGECNLTDGSCSAEEYPKLGVQHVIQPIALGARPLLAVPSASPRLIPMT